MPVNATGANPLFQPSDALTLRNREVAAVPSELNYKTVDHFSTTGASNAVSIWSVSFKES